MECQVDKKENSGHLLLFEFNRGAKAVRLPGTCMPLIVKVQLAEE